MVTEIPMTSFSVFHEVKIMLCIYLFITKPHVRETVSCGSMTRNSCVIIKNMPAPSQFKPS
jgi:hypothetical protein